MLMRIRWLTRAFSWFLVPNRQRYRHRPIILNCFAHLISFLISVSLSLTVNKQFERDAKHNKQIHLCFCFNRFISFVRFCSVSLWSLSFAAMRENRANAPLCACSRHSFTRFCARFVCACRVCAPIQRMNRRAKIE